MTNAQLFNAMQDTLDAVPPTVTAAWLANYHFTRQDFFTFAECLTVAKMALQAAN